MIKRWFNQVKLYMKTVFIGFMVLIKKPFSSVIFILILATSLSFPLLFLNLTHHLNALIDSKNEISEMNIFLKNDISEEKKNTLIKAVRNKKEVLSVEYVDKNLALNNVINNPLLLETIELLDYNPLPNSLLVVIKEKYRKKEQLFVLTEELSKYESIDFVQVDIAWLEKLSELLDFIFYFQILTLFLSVVVIVLIVSNYLHLDMQLNSKEIKLLYLLGATEDYICRKFIYMAIGLVIPAAILALCLSEVILFLLNYKIHDLFYFQSDLFSFSSIFTVNMAIFVMIICSLIIYCIAKIVKKYIHNLST